MDNAALQGTHVQNLVSALRDYNTHYHNPEEFWEKAVVQLSENGSCVLIAKNARVPWRAISKHDSLERMRRWLITQVMQHWSQMMCSRCAEFAKDEDDMSYPNGVAPLCNRCMEIENGEGR